MKKNLKVVQINGFRGLFLSLFIISCLVAGFIAFPAIVAMQGWNYIAIKTGSLPLINVWEGVLLWAIVAFSAYIFNTKKFIVSFNSQQELTEDEVREVVSKIKNQAIEHKILLPKEFPTNKENLKEPQTKSKEN